MWHWPFSFIFLDQICRNLIKLDQIRFFTNQKKMTTKKLATLLLIRLDQTWFNWISSRYHIHIRLFWTRSDQTGSVIEKFPSVKSVSTYWVHEIQKMCMDTFYRAIYRAVGTRRGEGGSKTITPGFDIKAKSKLLFELPCLCFRLSASVSASANFLMVAYIKEC